MAATRPRTSGRQGGDDTPVLWVGQLRALLACPRRLQAAIGPSHERPRRNPGASDGAFRLKRSVEQALVAAHTVFDDGEAPLEDCIVAIAPPELGHEERAYFLDALDRYADAVGDRPGRLLQMPRPLSAPHTSGAFRLHAQPPLALRRDDGTVEVRRLHLRSPASGQLLADRASGEPRLEDVAIAALLRANLPSIDRVEVRHLWVVGATADAVSSVEGIHIAALRETLSDAIGAARAAGSTARACPGSWCATCPEISGCPAVAQRPLTVPMPSAPRSAAPGSPPTLDPSLGQPVQPAPGIFSISPSRYRDYESCPRRFFLAHVLRLAPISDDGGRVGAGNQVHDELKARHDDPARHDDVEPVDPSGSGDPVVLQHAHAHAAVCPRDVAEYRGGEVDLRWYIPGKALLVTGRADALWRYPDGTIEVRDYKTGACPSSLEGDVPAAMYALLAAHLEPPASAVRVVYERLRAQDAKTVELTVTPTVLRDAAARIVDVAHKIRTEREFPARPAPASCRSCSYRDVCPKAADATAPVGTPGSLDVPARRNGRADQER